MNLKSAAVCGGFIKLFFWGVVLGCWFIEEGNTFKILGSSVMPQEQQFIMCGGHLGCCVVLALEDLTMLKCFLFPSHH